MGNAGARYRRYVTGPSEGPPVGSSPGVPGSGQPPTARTNVWAILSFIFGLVGLIGAPASVICGIIGLKRAKQGQGGRALAIAGLALSAVWVVVVVGVFAVTFILSGGSILRPLPTIGDCIAEMPSGVEGALNTTDCATPHEGEVVAVLTMPDGDFPAPETFDDFRRLCEQELAAYSPASVEDPSVGLYVRFPNRSTWGNGSREVRCVATLAYPRAGSIRG